MRGIEISYEIENRSFVLPRRATRASEASVIRSYFTMNNYLQARPLFIGQGDSKAVDGPFALQRMPNQDLLHNGKVKRFNFNKNAVTFNTVRITGSIINRARIYIDKNKYNRNYD